MHLAGRVALPKKQGVSLAECVTVNVDGLNCIDCLLGGNGKLLDIDPDRRFFFLTPGFLDFAENLPSGTTLESRRSFKMPKGIVQIQLSSTVSDNEATSEDFDH